MRRSSFEALKLETLASLDEGINSLKFFQLFAKTHMNEWDFRAFMKVYNDYNWTKTTIEWVFRMYTGTSDFNRDKTLLRDVLLKLYDYVIESVKRLLTDECIKCPEKAEAELMSVFCLLYKSAYSIANDECLLPIPFAVMKVRVNVAARPKEADVEFAAIVKAVEDKLAARRNILYSSS